MADKAFITGEWRSVGGLCVNGRGRWSGRVERRLDAGM